MLSDRLGRIFLKVLEEFLISNRMALIARARAAALARTSPKATDVELTNGIPVFLDQLCEALRLARSSNVVAHELITETAGRHGRELFKSGLTIGQVVHDYGDVCQAVTNLAVEQGAEISGEEFRTLNLCLDDAIAGAVTQYARQNERVLEDRGTERLGILAHEMRNLLNTAVLSFESIQNGRVAANGSTGLVLQRSLMGLCDLVDRSLAEVRLDAGIEHSELISVAELVDELEISTTIQAHARQLNFTVTALERGLTIKGDRQIIVAALANLLQNAFKFTRERSRVSLTVTTTVDCVLFAVEDECGGLPPGKTEDLFRPFEQQSDNHTGLGLGLTITRKAAKANGGEIRVRNLPGKGCVFTLALPKLPSAQT